jgi:hypothetical protein
MKPEEVRRKIQKCKTQRLTALDLSNKWKPSYGYGDMLTAIPAEIFDFT